MVKRAVPLRLWIVVPASDQPYASIFLRKDNLMPPSRSNEERVI